MSPLAFLGVLPALLAAAFQGSPDQSVVRRVVVRDEVIWRIPVRPRLSPMVEWKEHKGPKCLAAGAISGAMLSGPSSIDFVMHDRTRFRAEMDSECPALDFYGGFYLQPDDEKICAKREEVSTRAGGSCRIERFKRLESKPQR
ncbi:MAG: hypothetical protein H0W65_10040 [Sphingomonas sp.]|uniref:hypothetical protein n=1 Tax=Sphingomonas sp. TaxID=28214 RepID=UPI0017FB576C|nr:hypothetical protein [Sphingomonas sp.]MBA3668046.1 hypothetical protein [Sphingomonas sp.]